MYISTHVQYNVMYHTQTISAWQLTALPNARLRIWRARALYVYIFFGARRRVS